MPERDIERYLHRRCKEIGAEIRRVRWLGRRHCPDDVVFLDGGRLIWIEAKRPGAVPEPGQVREHALLRARGQRVEIADSEEAVDRILGNAMFSGASTEAEK